MGIYLFTGKDVYRQEAALKTMLQKHGIDRDHTYVFDGKDPKFKVETALMECDAISLFAEDMHKAVIIREPFFLNASAKESTVGSKKKKGDAERDRRIAVMTEYFKHQNPDAELYFYCHHFDADARKKEYKLIKSYGEVVEFKQMKEWEFEKYIDSELKKYHLKLTQDARKELSLRVNNSTMDLHNAIEKIQLYGTNELNLTDIQHLVSLNPDVNAFRMADCFLKGDIGGCMRSKDEMLAANYTIQSLLPMLAAKIRSSYNMKLLYERGLSRDMIATRLKANPYAVKFSLEAVQNISAHKLLRYLNDLAEIDQGAKAGLLDLQQEFDRFLIQNGIGYERAR